MEYFSKEYTFELVENWARLPAGWDFKEVSGLEIDARDRIYVLNRSEHPLMVFDLDGNLITSWEEGYFQRPHAITSGFDDSIWCVDDDSHVVTKFTREGKVLLELGTKGKPSDTGYVKERGVEPTVKRVGPPFNRPTGVALSPEGEIFVSDGYGNARIHKFSPEGKLLLSWGFIGSDPGQFNTPHSVWFETKQRHVWVVDRDNNRIQIFDTNGAFLTQWTDLSRPTDIFIDEDNKIVYVSEIEQRVSIFTLDGKLISRFGNTEQNPALFNAPHTISVDSKGDLYIGQVLYGSKSKRTVEFALDTKALLKFVRKH